MAWLEFFSISQAKLPRGIKNIRPHLENVDNVPLLVSLFTDCSADATCEMLNIMQSYGEIVICIGSSASSANADTFLQADCSIAIEPLYPQVNVFWNRKKHKITISSTDSDKIRKFSTSFYPWRFVKTSPHTLNRIYSTIANRWRPPQDTRPANGSTMNRHASRTAQLYRPFIWAAS